MTMTPDTNSTPPAGPEAAPPAAPPVGPTTSPAASPAVEAIPWARQTTVKAERATARVRQMVDKLPSWEPLPPGELVVRRPGTSR